MSRSKKRNTHLLNFVIIFILFLMILMIAVIVSGCSNKKSIISYDFSTYLGDDSDFSKNVSTVLPSKERLEDQKIISYLFYDNGKSNESSMDKMIQMTVEYSDDVFPDFVSEIENHASVYKNESMGSNFYYNEVPYDGFMVTEYGYCAIAYHVCQDSKTISYLAFDCWQLQFMDVESALSLFPQIENVDQLLLS